MNLGSWEESRVLKDKGANILPAHLQDPIRFQKQLSDGKPPEMYWPLPAIIPQAIVCFLLWGLLRC